ncbi:MAG: LON peptidase substrate-binding domain-containing protein [Planctomycetes bacterium]|nr:LON peptidase substrate-binding domain-containing protein [Planctomycetota bacterium]
MVHGRKPPPRAWNGPMEVPVFPLPGVFLFPGCVMPLHVFEPRYRQMVSDLLDRHGRLVMGTLLDGVSEVNGPPRFHHVAGLGEIGRHEELADGRFLIWLVGLARVRVEEIDSDRLYRRVRIEPLEEWDVPADEESGLRARVQAALLARCDEFLNLPAGVPLSHLIDLLLQRLQLPTTRMVELFSETDLRLRAEGALAEHARRALPPPQS